MKPPFCVWCLAVVEQLFTKSSVLPVSPFPGHWLEKADFHWGHFCLHPLAFLGYLFLQFQIWNVVVKNMYLYNIQFPQNYLFH